MKKEIKENREKIRTFENSEARMKHCEKCGEEIGNYLIDGEVVAYCKKCKWVTY